MRIWKIATLLTCLLLQMRANALVDGSEIILFTPWSYVQTSLQNSIAQQNVSEKQIFPTLDLQLNPWTPHLTNVVSEMSAGLKLTHFDPNSFDIASQQTSIQLSIRKLVIDQVIQQNISGIILNVRVQAECGAFTMSQPAAQVSASVHYDVLPNQIATQVTKFNLQWKPGTWKMGMLSCTGPAGIEKTIKADLQTQLKNADTLKPWLTQIIGDRIQTQANQLITKLLTPSTLPGKPGMSKMTVDMIRMEPTQEGVLTRGTLIWSTNKSTSNLARLKVNRVPNSLVKIKTPVILSALDGWTTMIQQELSQLASTTTVNLNKIADFKNLLASKITQSVAWPDLLNYTPASPFTATIAPPQGFSLAWHTDGTADMQGPASGTIHSIRSGKNWNYLLLSGEVAGKLKLNIAAGVLSAVLTVTQSNAHAQFGASYVQAFSPNQKLDPQVLSAFNQAIEQSYNFKTELPEFDLDTMGTLRFEGWSLADPGVVATTLKTH